MRAKVAVANMDRARATTLIVAALAALAVFTLAACAHAPIRMVADGGEVSRFVASPVPSAGQGATYRPITLDELTAAANVRPVGRNSAPRPELWQGTYVGRTYGQRGALALALRPSTDGTVRGTVAWRVSATRSTLAVEDRDTTALVRVQIVSATRDADHLVLQLDSFFDPACNCTARATFRAFARGDTLVGRFTVDGAATLVGEERGHWRAIRATP